MESLEEPIPEEELLVLSPYEIELLKDGPKIITPEKKILWRNLLMKLDFWAAWNRSLLSRALGHYGLLGYSADSLTEYLPEPVFSVAEGRQFRNLDDKMRIKIIWDLKMFYKSEEKKTKKQEDKEIAEKLSQIHNWKDHPHRRTAFNSDPYR